jgi:hypothetical protein
MSFLLDAAGYKNFTKLYPYKLPSKWVISSWFSYKTIFLVTSTVFKEFRQHGIPYLFFTSVHSVCGTELVKIPQNHTEFRGAEVRLVPRNIAKFCLSNFDFLQKNLTSDFNTKKTSFLYEFIAYILHTEFRTKNSTEFRGSKVTFA